jgi:type VI secretion system protein ImpI
MRITLRVISHYGRPPTDVIMRSFESRGFTIGRSPHNDLVLPDTDRRIVSSVHARIDFRDGAFYLNDPSTNGTYIDGIDGSPHRVGPGAWIELKNGHELTIGDYVIGITIESPAPADPDDIPTPQSRIPIDFDFSAPKPCSIDRPVAIADPDAGYGGKSDNSDLSSSALNETDLAISSLLSGAGITGQPLSASPEKFLENTGILLRALVFGLFQCISVRREVKSELRLSQTMLQATENNPLKFSCSPEDALKKLLLDSANPAYLPPLAAINEAFSDLMNHEAAVFQALRSVLESLVNKLDPEEIERKVSERNAIGSFLSPARKAKCWESYIEIYRSISSDAQEGFVHLLGVEFYRAYMNHVSALRPSRGESR